MNEKELSNMKKVNMVKRFTAALLSAALLLGLLCACGSDDPGQGSSNLGGAPSEQGGAPSGKQYVIGIAEAQANDEVTIRRAYLENFIAPTYNCKFIFSEVLKDDAATKAFIENCIDSGADAIIDFKSLSGQMAQLCADNGLVYAMNGTYEAHPEFLEKEYPTFAGAVGTNNAQVSGLYADWLERNTSADGNEGFLIATGLASSGNVQHSSITTSVLEALRDKYSLTYDKSIEEYVAVSETTNVGNDKNVLITLYPGSPNKDTWLPGVSTLIQSEKYGVFLSAGQTYNQSATVVNEVEAASGKNIKVASLGALGTTLNTAFETLDPTGNPSVDMVTVKSCTVMTSCLFAITYNALQGKIPTACRVADGKPARFNFNLIMVESPEQLKSMTGWDDKDAQNWIAGKDFVDSMLCIDNPDITAEDINAVMSDVSYETIAARMK